MKFAIAAALAVSLLTGAATAQQRPQLPAECREQLRALCQDQMGGGMRDCVRGALRQVGDECRKAVSANRAAAEPLPAGMAEHAYGADPAQRLDLIAPPGNARPPLIVFIHGGGWAIGDKRLALGAKAAHFGKSYGLASVNYRLVPNVTVEQQAADIAAAIAWLRRHPANYDGGRIVLMGHSAGAHLAALLATDPDYLAAAGVPLSAVRGVVLLDGAGYDVAAQVASNDALVAEMYTAAFGRDARRHALLSPTAQAAAPNAGDWLILPIGRRRDSQVQSHGLATALTAAGARVELTSVPGASHRDLNQQLGTAGDFATERVDAFLARLR